MEDHTSILLLVVFTIAVIGIVSEMIRIGLIKSGLFKGKQITLLTVCVSLLCILGLHRFVNLDNILLFYATLAISLLALWLFHIFRNRPKRNNKGKKIIKDKHKPKQQKPAKNTNRVYGDK